MMFDARQAAAVITELTQFGCSLCCEIAKEQIRLLIIDAHIKAAGGLRIEPLDRRITIDGIKLVRLNIAEQAFLGFLIGIVGGRQQIIALYFALEEERRAGARRALAAILLIGEVLQLLLEAVLFTSWNEGAGIQITQIHHPLDDTGGN